MTEPTYVLVPGGGGAGWCWHRVVSELAGLGIASIAVDLPADDPAAGLPEYVDVIVEAASGCDDVVLVGLSLGGFSASAAAARLPASGLVLHNAMIPRPGETAGEWWSATGQGEAMRANDVREGRDPEAGMDDSTFFHDVDPSIAAEAADHERDETDTVFAAPWPLDAWPDVPTRVIAGRDDRLFPLEFQRRVARERLGLDVEVVPGGHLAALSHPREVTDALLLPFG